MPHYLQVGAQNYQAVKMLWHALTANAQTIIRDREAHQIDLGQGMHLKLSNSLVVEMSLKRLYKIRATLSRIKEVSKHPRNLLYDKLFRLLKLIVERHGVQDLKVISERKLRSPNGIRPLSRHHSTVLSIFRPDIVVVVADILALDLAGIHVDDDLTTRIVGGRELRENVEEPHLERDRICICVNGFRAVIDVDRDIASTTLADKPTDQGFVPDLGGENTDTARIYGH